MSTGTGDIPWIIDMHGTRRKLAKLPVREDHRKMRAAMTSFKAHLAANGLPLIPQTEWREVDNSQTMGKQFIRNQFTSSGCTGFSAAQAFMRLLFSRGYDYQDLSGAFIYALINGGQDAGSVITDSMAALEQHGVCLRSEFDYPKIYPNQITPAAKQSALTRRLKLGLTIGGWDEVCTAIQMGYYPQFAIEVAGNFERFDANGVAGFTPANYGNHSVHADGMKKLPNGEWVIHMPNTWGMWGPFGDGCCYLRQQHIDDVAHEGDNFVHIVPQLSADPVPTPA